jgi:hypothetical protein
VIDEDDYDPDDWDARDRELASEPLLAAIERALDNLIRTIGCGLSRPASQQDVIALYSRFKRSGWSTSVDSHADGYFSLTLTHPNHGTLFRQCWCGDRQEAPGPCGSVYNRDSRVVGFDFVPSILPGHTTAVEKFLSESVVFMKMGLIGPTGRKPRSR